MMQEDSSQPFFGGNSYGTTNTAKRYEPPPEIPISSVPDPDYYTSASVQMSQPFIESLPIDRVKNFPICKPVIHHSISTDISPDRRLFVRKVYVGWWFHSCCLFWNLCVMLGCLITGEAKIGGFLYSLIGLILGPLISCAVYFLLYRAMRTSSAFFFVLWFAFFVGQVASEVFFAIGFSDYGAAGFVLMASTFGDNKIALGVLATISTFMWVGVAVYSVWIFYQARIEFKLLGGTSAASKEFATRGAQTVYDNKDTIRQVAVENKDALVSFAKDHKQEIIQVAMDNKDIVQRVAVENQDAIWANRDVVASVFDQNTH